MSSRSVLRFEASPPGPLSLTGEGEQERNIVFSSLSPSPVTERGSGGEVSKGRPSWFSTIPLLVVLPALLVHLIPGAAERLELDRSRLAAGELWRLVTCHFAHWTPEHLLWDLGTAAALAIACAPFGLRRIGATLGAAAVAVPLAVWLALPSIERYRGLSGLASALFVLLAVAVLRTARADGRRVLALAAGAALAGFAAKLAWELTTGSSVFVGSDAGFVAVPLAHVVGAACGWFSRRDLNRNKLPRPAA